MVMSKPRPEAPSEIRGRQTRFWDWLRPLENDGTVEACYVRAGRGAIVVFNVPDHETLHRYMTNWSDAVPAEFSVIPLIERSVQEEIARLDK